MVTSAILDVTICHSRVIIAHLALHRAAAPIVRVRFSHWRKRPFASTKPSNLQARTPTTVGAGGNSILVHHIPACGIGSPPSETVLLAYLIIVSGANLYVAVTGNGFQKMLNNALSGSHTRTVMQRESKMFFHLYSPVVVFFLLKPSTSNAEKWMYLDSSGGLLVILGNFWPTLGRHLDPICDWTDS